MNAYFRGGEWRQENALFSKGLGKKFIFLLGIALTC